MSYLDRLNPTIDFVSPQGREFSAKWRGSNRAKSKKIGSFSPPRKLGTVVQDLDMQSTSYPMSIIFDGQFHDVVARLFFETCDESGTWQVVHPIHGELRLQLISVTEKNQPVENQGFTELDLEWIEPIEDDALISSAQLAEDIEAQLIQLNQAAADQLAAIAKQDSSFTIQSLKNAISSVTDTITNVTNAIREFNADIARITNEIQRALNTALLQPTLAINSISGQIQQLAQLPALTTRSVQARFDTYNTLFQTISGNTPSEISTAGRNEVAIKELSQAAVIGVLPQIVSTGDIQTRAQAIEFAEFLIDSFTDITNNLDADQELFEDETIDVQYFSQSGTYTDAAKIISLGIEFLLRSSFDLKIEKRFRLKKPLSPAAITIQEYGELGENDSNLDLFIESNNLKSDEIILLPAGREVVVYV